ncbi:hypothetical protein CIB84_003594, partial [Bambusicola thoracicus]
VQYCGLLFRHEGWPLCIHEKIVVQLASIDWRILKPGDFYLQVVPYLKKSPRIVLKCLAKDKHNVEEVVIPEVSYTSIFTLEWLSTINGERMGIALENCLLTTDDKIFRVPWDNVVNPEFINKPKIAENNIIAPETTGKPSLLCLPMDHAEGSLPDLESQYRQEQSPNCNNLVVSSPAPRLGEALVNGVCSSPVPEEDLQRDLEGEYVELAEVSLPRFGPQTGSLTQSLALNYLTQPRTRVNASKGKHRFIVIQDSTYSKNLVHSALTQKEHCQMDALSTSPEVLKNVIPLENNKTTACEELSPEGQLLSGGPGSMGNSFPAAAAPSCSAEDSCAAEQEAWSECSVDWQYAPCSNGDVCAGDGVSCKAQTTGSTGNMELESDGSSINPGVEILEQSPGANLDAAAEEEVIMEEHGELLAEHQHEVTQVDLSLGSVLGPLGPCCTLKEGPYASCQNAGESTIPVHTIALPATPGSSAVGVERGSPSGNMTDAAAARACADQETNYSCSVNPPEQLNGGEVGEIELGRRESPEDVKEIEQVQAVKEHRSSCSCGSTYTPVDGALSDGEEQEVPACQHKRAEDAMLPQTALPAESEQVTEQSGTSGSSLGLDAQAEDSNQFGSHRSGERCGDPRGWTENQGHGSEANSVLNPECVSAQDSQGGEENQDSFSDVDGTKAVALRTLESIEEELEVGPLSSGPAEGNTELTALHSHPEAVPEESSPKGMVSDGAEVVKEVSGADVLKPAGTRDKSGRAVAIITTRNTAWLNPHCNTTELVRLLLYLHSIPRPECQALGLTVLVDARRCSPVPALFKAFSILQDMDPHCIHGVLLLVERDLTFRMEKPTAGQFEILTSMKSLHKHIDSSQLPLELDGTFPYCHRDWLSFRMVLLAMQDCRKSLEVAFVALIIIPLYTLVVEGA